MHEISAHSSLLHYWKDPSDQPATKRDWDDDGDSCKCFEMWSIERRLTAACSYSS